MTETARIKRRPSPALYYAVAVVGVFVLPLIGRLGAFMGPLGVPFWAVCSLLILPWAGWFCWLAWRRTDEVAQAAHRAAWMKGGSAGAIIALAVVMLALIFVTGQSLTYRARSLHDETPAVGASPWIQTLSLSTGEPDTARRVERTWQVEGSHSIQDLLAVVLAQGIAIGALATLALQALLAALVWGGWWGRIWGASLEKEP